MVKFTTPLVYPRERTSAPIKYGAQWAPFEDK
jgi:hypothetical protein